MIRTAAIIIAALPVLGAAALPAAADGPHAPVVARMVHAIMEYTRWPARAEPLVLCVAGPALHGGELGGLTLSDGRTVSRRAVAASPQALAGCDALYIGQVPVPTARALADAVRGRGVLTIAEADPEARTEAMVCLVFRPGAVTFRLNVDAVSHSGLRVDPRVLRLAEDG